MIRHARRSYRDALARGFYRGLVICLAVELAYSAVIIGRGLW